MSDRTMATIAGKSVKESVAEAIEYFMSHHTAKTVVAQAGAANLHPETSR